MGACPMSQPVEPLQRPHRLWSPVQRSLADNLLLVLIAVFGATVLIVRVYLELTGYPQIGGRTFHIAHVLWGGLALFLAVLLLLIVANRWALWMGAVLGGIGVGLFIDEVGKFITQSVDYFFPLAFPIIYSVIVICVWLYLRVRRSQPRTTRALLYHALDEMKQVLDNDLDPFEHRELQQMLMTVAAEATDPAQQRLAREMLDFVSSRELRLAISPNWAERQMLRMQHLLANYPSRFVLRIALVLGFALMAAQGLLRLVEISVAGFLGGVANLTALFAQVTIVSGNAVYIVNQPILLIIDTCFIIITGVLALTAAVLMAIGREKSALRIGTLALALALTIVNLITFYFNQLNTFLDAFGQLCLLALAQWYRWRFLAGVAGGQPVVAKPETTVMPLKCRTISRSSLPQRTGPLADACGF